jgi:hypothetical protein
MPSSFHFAAIGFDSRRLLQSRSISVSYKPKLSNVAQGTGVTLHSNPGMKLVCFQSLSGI